MSILTLARPHTFRTESYKINDIFFCIGLLKGVTQFKIL